MKLKNGDKAVSFFKIIRKNSVDYLPLPTPFAEKHMEKGNNAKKQTLVLDPNSGVKWSVKYLKIDDKYYFLDGWFGFMKENQLRKHDLLVFWLLPDASHKSTFQVLLYAPDGSLKHPPIINTSSALFPSILPTTGRRRSLLAEEKVTVDEVMRDGKKRNGKEESDDDDDDDVDDEEDDDSEDDDDDDSLQKAHKSIIIWKSYLNQLQMTKGYWKANGLDAYNCVRLKTEEGKMWEVKVAKCGPSNCPRLIRGWKEFVRGNKIVMGNILEITHVKDNMLQVRVTKGKKGRIIKKKRSN